MRARHVARRVELQHARGGRRPGSMWNSWRPTRSPFLLGTEFVGVCGSSWALARSPDLVELPRTPTRSLVRKSLEVRESSWEFVGVRGSSWEFVGTGQITRSRRTTAHTLAVIGQEVPGSSWDFVGVCVNSWEFRKGRVYEDEMFIPHPQLQLHPRCAWSDDIRGISPGPIGPQ